MFNNDIFNSNRQTKDYCLDRERRLNWTEEIFIDQGDQNLKVERDSFTQFLGSAVSKRKILLIFGFFVLAFLFLLGRGIYLQVVKGGYYYQLAEGNRIRVVPLKAPRGVVYDSAGKQLVKNLPSFNLLITPADLPKDLVERDKVIANVSQIIGLATQEISDLLLKNKSHYIEAILIKAGLDYEQTVLLSIYANNWPGVSLEQGYRREYLFGDAQTSVNSLSHILGYTGQLTEEEYQTNVQAGYFLNDQIGKTGLELTYEKLLKGINGRKQVEVDALGKEKEIIAQEESQSGTDLVLSLNYDLQKTAETALADTLKKFNKSRGAVVVLNPQNGEILALVALPTFDSNQFAIGLSNKEYSDLINNPNKPLFNRSIAGAYPSGSTIKPVMAAAALEEGVITPQTTFNSVGGIRIDRWFFPDWQAGGHGLTNVYRALAWSVNTFFYMIGGGYPQGGNPTKDYEFIGLGPERIVKYLEKFGLGQRAGIDLNNEAEGFVPTVEWKNETLKEPWYIGDTYNLSIGQGNLLVTPLQVANWTATVANGGTLYWPHLVKELVDSQKQQTTPVAARVVGSGFISAVNVKVVQDGMRQAVLNGSASLLAGLSVPAAAKTGTAQWSNDKSPHAWFTCYAPFEKPQIVVTVLIEEGEEGSRTSIVVANEILRWYFNN
ncbi:MAG: penicillin-binding protein 2, partial [Patescibacteria group bacterium]